MSELENKIKLAQALLDAYKFFIFDESSSNIAKKFDEVVDYIQQNFQNCKDRTTIYHYIQTWR